MELLKLYQYAADHDICIDDFPLTGVKSLSLPGNIAINETAFESAAEKATCIAHELGHCETGSFYSIHCKFDLREKHEYRANKWAYLHFLPPDEITLAVKSGITEKWELAEYFNVTEQLLHKAIEYYKNNKFIDLDIF